TEKLYAVEPVGVETRTASAAYCTNRAPSTSMPTAAIPSPGIRTRAMSLNALITVPSGSTVETAVRDSTVYRCSSIADSAAGSPGTSTSARKPRRPTLTPRTGVLRPSISRMVRSIVPSPPRLTSSVAWSINWSSSTATAEQSMRSTSSCRPSTVTSRSRAQPMIVSIAVLESRRGCSTRPTVCTSPMAPLYGRKALVVQARHAAHLVHRVQGRHLVRLGQGRVVEDRVDEVVDRAATAHHGLPDVDDLGSAGTEDVHPQQLVVVRRHQELQHAVRVADDLPARQLTVAGDAHLERDPAPGQLVL